MTEDSVAARIRKLTAEHLHYIARSADGWDSLYHDPTDGRLWELTYPHSGRHGGGPQALRVLGAEAALEKYGAASESRAAPPG